MMQERFERMILHRVQRAILKTRVMNEDLLRELVRRLVISSGQEEFTNQKNIAKLVNIALNWWTYEGQWNWPMSSTSPSSINDILIDLFHNHKELLSLEYRDLGLKFRHKKSDLPEVGFQMKEVRPKNGKHSLFPEILPIDALLPEDVDCVVAYCVHSGGEDRTTCQSFAEITPVETYFSKSYYTDGVQILRNHINKEKKPIPETSGDGQVYFRDLMRKPASANGEKLEEDSGSNTETEVAEDSTLEGGMDE